MEARGKVDRDGAGQDQGDQQRLVEVAGDDHLVARPDRRHQEGVVPGRGAVEQEEAAVGAPGVGRERLGLAEGVAAEVRVADAAAERDVAVEGALAKRGEELGVGADAELVARRREGDEALPLVGDDAFQDRRPPVIDGSPRLVPWRSANERRLLHVGIDLDSKTRAGRPTATAARRYSSAALEVPLTFPVGHGHVIGALLDLAHIEVVLDHRRLRTPAVRGCSRGARRWLRTRPLAPVARRWPGRRCRGTRGRLDLVLDAVQAGGEDRGVGQVGVGVAAGQSVFDAQ